MSLHLKTVQSLFIVLLLCFTQATSISAQQAISEWRSAVSGDFNNAGGTVWERNVVGTWTLQAAAARPSGSSNVTIRAGHTVTLSATTSILGLTIEAGATLNSTATSPSTVTFRIGTSSSADVTAGYTNNVVVIQNDGVFGSTTGTGDGIAFEMSPNCASLTIQGSGITKLARFRPQPANPNSPATFTVNQNMDLVINNNYAFTGTQNGSSQTATENFIININAGKTVKLYSGGSFHGTSTVQGNPSGTYTYNIFGTLDNSAASWGFLTSTAGNPSLNLNIKNGGTMKLGPANSIYRGGNNGSINLTIESGGIVDGTAATSINNNNSMLGTGYTWFVTQGTGTLKQTVGATSTTFPIGASLTSYNPVTLNNGGGNAFSASVVAGNTPGGLPNVTKALNRTWGIVPATFPATADITFGYNTGEGNASCVLADPMQLNFSTGGAWSALGTATPSVPSSGSTNFQVSYSGTASFGFFNLVNGTAIPVELTTFKGYAKGVVNMLEWSTATERNNREFAIERSINGVDFQQIGSVKGHGNASTVNNYSFTDDAAPLSIGYYRLRQIDFDGKETVSKAVTIARNGSGKVGLTKLYPSVTSDYLNIEMTTVGNTSLTITDLMGRVVSTRQLGDTNGSLLQRLDVTNLSSGLYFVTLQSGSSSLTEKFEKK